VRQSEILYSHLIQADYLQTDDFKSFIAARTESLATLIEFATGKSIDRPKILDMTESEDEDFEDDSETWEDSDGIDVIA